MIGKKEKELGSLHQVYIIIASEILYRLHYSECNRFAWDEKTLIVGQLLQSVQYFYITLCFWNLPALSTASPAGSRTG